MKKNKPIQISRHHNHLLQVIAFSLALAASILQNNTALAQTDNCDDIIVFERETGRCGGMMLDWDDTVIISGIVVDTDGIPLKCATIYALDSNDVTIISSGTKSDKHGNFTLIAMKSFGMHLHITKQGYKMYNKKISDFNNTSFLIRLNSDTTTLDKNSSEVPAR